MSHDPAMYRNWDALTRKEVQSRLASAVRSNVFNSYLSIQDGHAVNAEQTNEGGNGLCGVDEGDVDQGVTLMDILNPVVPAKNRQSYHLGLHVFRLHRAETDAMRSYRIYQSQSGSLRCIHLKPCGLPSTSSNL